ncbi:unnamed protein product [Diabrotica balteata]|uniref:Uncharacterized protein n=1 Tax=Diabrotica balteata TaxID=107213 RepID=A0A9N9X670_DIABA|nr:unnamed protein product [Diabrotica balteata]
MKSLLLTTIVLFAFYQAVNGIVCLPNYCDSVKCAENVVCKDSQYLQEDGSYCGCCDVCYSKLYEGDICIGELLIGGYPFRARCVEGLKCSRDTAKCVKAY